jgi:hypothetical protein
MIRMQQAPDCSGELAPPRRNRYFFGKDLGVFHFELETDYHSSKRRLLNRLVVGHGVVCGLNVTPYSDGDRHGLLVSSGLAIDGHGREIVVGEARPFFDDRLNPHDADEPGDEPQQSPSKNHCDDVLHLVLCYHECEGRPAAVHASECQPEPCQPDTIVERYCLELRDGPVPEELRPAGLCMPDCIRDGSLDYDTLVEYVSECCPDCPDDPCIPLAEIRLSDDPSAEPDVDISVRPIVFGNDLLYQLLLCLLTESKRRRSK